MRTKLTAIMAAVVVAMSLVQSANALSIFVHNGHIPLQGALVRYVVYDVIPWHGYIFDRHLTYETPDVELSLPDAVKPGALIIVTMEEKFPDDFGYRSNLVVMGEGGLEVGFNLK
jgi:hypothetical protein